MSVLKTFGIELVVDIRRWPSSKKFPWFNKEEIERRLRSCSIDYVHFPELGGYRKEGYEAFSKSKEFRDALQKLLELVKNKNSVLLCSELLWWRCHRRYVAEELTKLGCSVVHIFDEKRIQEHKLREEEIKEKMKLRLWCDKRARRLKS